MPALSFGFAKLGTSMIGEAFKTTGPLLVLMGAVTTVFGLLRSRTFLISLPGFEKAIPKWLGCLCFVAVGAWLIYIGITRWR
jgi:hypothetical protein